MKVISEHQINRLNEILENLKLIENLYQEGKKDYFDNFAYYIGRISGLAMISRIDLEVLTKMLNESKNVTYFENEKENK